MLYKPTSPSPCIDSVIINPDDTKKKITFQCSTFNGSEILKTRLKLMSNNIGYYFNDDEESPTTDFTINKIAESDYGNTITWATSSENFSNILTDVNGYYIGMSSKNLKRTLITDTKSPKSFNDIFVSTVPNIWQMRCYEANCDNIIGYGMIEGSSSISGSYDKHIFKTIGGGHVPTASDYYYIKIRPHTNVYNQYALSSSGNLVNPTPSAGKEGHVDDLTLSQLYIYYDDHAKYSLKVNGEVFPITEYMYRVPSNAELQTSDIDGYGNPLYAYVIIPYSDSLRTKCTAGMQYQICSNFIDSDEFYYSISPTPTLSITIDNSAVPENNSQDSPLHIQTSRPEVIVSYKDTSAVINYYNFTIFKLNGNTKSQIYSSGNIYSSNVHLDFDKFFNGTEYLIRLSIFDTNQLSIIKDIYVRPDYGDSYDNSYIDAKFCSDHGSAIIDWSNTISITPNIQGDISFNQNGICIPNDGTVSYDTIDGVGNLKFDENVVALKIKIGDSFQGENITVRWGQYYSYNTFKNVFFDSEDDNGHRRILSYTGLGFELTEISGDRIVNGEWVYRPSRTVCWYKESSAWRYSDWSGKWSSMETALKSSEDNITDIHYIYDEQNPQAWDFGDTPDPIYYWHEEDFINSQYFLIILHPPINGGSNLTVVPLEEG